jgi:predicted Abi (CAAX) family protease
MSSKNNERTLSNYERYWQADFNRPDYYPIAQHLDTTWYRPIAPWMGRLILPAFQERSLVLGCWFEVYHAPPEHTALVGQKLRLRWEPTPGNNARFWGVTRNVLFDEDAEKLAKHGTVLAERLNTLINVNPFESLAGSRPNDDMVVRLEGKVRVDAQPGDGDTPIVYVGDAPTEISGRYYALVRFIGPSGSGDGYTVRHYDRASGDFTGAEEVVRMPEVVPDGNGTRNSTAGGIERSPINELGWYMYGAQDTQGRFVVKALAARKLLRLVPDLYTDGEKEGMEYLRPKAWRKACVKGQVSTAIIAGQYLTPFAARESWQVGDRGLLIHLYGGIGGENAEPAAKTPLYWGHFSFGVATVIEEPLAGEPIFDIVYQQVYAHNADGLIAGAIHYSKYAGDRQYGWAGVRPIQDMIIKVNGITGSFEIFGALVSPLDSIIDQLEVMQARYRIADGRGATKVGMLNNCAQDGSQALYIALRNMSKLMAAMPQLRAEMTDTAEEAQRFKELNILTDELQRVLLPWGSARDDWEYGIPMLGAGADGFIGTVSKAANSWRTMLPPVAARAMAEVFVERGASIWVLRSYQIGGDDPTIEPYVPNV